MDTIALIGAKVTEKEDIDEVVDYARLKGISIFEALATNVVKTILKDKAEQRASAEATNTGPARRGSAKLTDEQILEAASKGKEVDPDPALGSLLQHIIHRGLSPFALFLRAGVAYDKHYPFCAGTPEVLVGCSYESFVY